VAQITPDAVNPLGKIDAADFISPSEVTDKGALQLVVADADRTQSWLQKNYWSLRWREADSLYQSPPGILLWESTTVPRANVNRFVVAETVNAIHPQIMNGLFYEKPPFKLRPRPNITENTSRAISALLEIELDEMKLPQETDWMIHSALLFGTGVAKWGFKSYTKKVAKYVALGSDIKVPSSIPGEEPTEIPTSDSTTFTKILEEQEVHVPTFENKDIRYILVETGCRVPDIRKAKFVIDRMYLTYRDLIKLKDEEYVTEESGKQVLKKRYDLPAESEIKSWFEAPKEPAQHPGGNDIVQVQGTTQIHHAEPRFKSTTADPLDEPLEVLERWDNDKVITVLNRVKVIRNEANEFGVIPFLSVNWWNIPDAFWGLGLGRVIGVEQRVQAGLINACLDLASLIVNPMWVRARGANIQEQQIRQRIGGIIAVDVGGNSGLRGAGDALQMLPQPQIPGEIIQQIALSEGRVEKTSGANQQLTMGATPTQSKGQGMRSAAGATGIIQATMNRIGGFAEMFVRQVYEPLLYQMHQLNKDKMPMSYVKKLLGEKLGPEFKFKPADFLNAPAEFEVLAGSHLAAKGQMAQSLFMMTQVFDNQQMLEQLSLQGKKVNVEELLHMMHDISGFKNYYDIIQDMTPEEIQRKQAQSPGGMLEQKFQNQTKLTDQKAQIQSQVVDQENEARAARDVFRIIAEKSAEPEALLGAEAPTQGLGSNTQG
jgi:hypothetical protein